MSTNTHLFFGSFVMTDTGTMPTKCMNMRVRVRVYALTNE